MEQVSAWFRTGDARGTRRTQLFTNFHHRDEQPYGGLRPICPSLPRSATEGSMPTPSSLTRSFKSCEYFKPTSNRLHIECLHRVSNGLIGNAIDLVANHRVHLVRFANYGEKRLPSQRGETLPSRDVFHNLSWSSARDNWAPVSECRPHCGCCQAQDRSRTQAVQSAALSRKTRCRRGLNL